MAGGKFPADEINDRALERLFATRLKTGEEKEIFEVSEHNLEEERSWLKFSIGRQTWTADTQGKEWLLENCQGQPTGTVQIFTRDHFATRSRKPEGGGKPKTLEQYWMEEQKEWREASKEKKLHALIPPPFSFIPTHSK